MPHLLYYINCFDSSIFRELGTSVTLKNKFAGYIIELIVKRENVQEIIDLVSTQLNGIVEVTMATIYTQVKRKWLMWLHVFVDLV